jgi:hypothetical protein
MLVASGVFAQEPAMRVGGDPVQVVQAFLDAVAQERYSDAARLLDSTGRQRRDLTVIWSGPMLIALHRRGGRWLITPNDAMLRNPSSSYMYVDCQEPDTSGTVRTRPPQ